MDKIPKAIIAGFPGNLIVEINGCLYGMHLHGIRETRVNGGLICLVLCQSLSLTTHSIKIGTTLSKGKTLLNIPFTNKQLFFDINKIKCLIDNFGEQKVRDQQFIYLFNYHLLNICLISGPRLACGGHKLRQNMYQAKCTFMVEKKK